MTTRAMAPVRTMRRKVKIDDAEEEEDDDDVGGKDSIVGVGTGDGDDVDDEEG